MHTRFPNAWDVFIAGGGPAGLATALAARRHGLSVIIADGAVPPIDKPCGEGLMPDGVEALQQLGVTIPKGYAHPFRGIRFVSHGMKAEAVFPRGTAYGIRRTHLHRVLVEYAAACGVRMLWQSAVTGLHPEGALVAGELVRARWVVGADGTSSRVRNWANIDPREPDVYRSDVFRSDVHQPDARKLDGTGNQTLRFAFRRHYRIAPWTDFMELHWGSRSQVYVTPVASNEVSVALISFNPKLRLRMEDMLEEFPDLASHLKQAELASGERGAITVTRSLRRVYRDRSVLVGDASGGVDAITGEGLCLAFRQANLLGDCLASGNLARYQKAHRAMFRRPAFMAHMMLFMAKHSRLRQRAMQVFQSSPRSFAGMLDMHVGVGSARNHISNGIALGWELIKA
ncbi:MAG: NAD(P)/FAD-dependent oxidoreductase [Terriglobales bacterium]